MSINMAILAVYPVLLNGKELLAVLPSMHHSFYFSTLDLLKFVMWIQDDSPKSFLATMFTVSGMAEGSVQITS
jgi:hypothetical protein